MAGHGHLMALLDSRSDRTGRLQQHHQGPVSAAAVVIAGSAGFQTLHHQHFSVAQPRYEEEGEVGRMAAGGRLWTVAAYEHRRLVAADPFRQARSNAIQPLSTLAKFHQDSGPGGQPPDWDRGGGLARHVGSLPQVVVDDQTRLRQQSVFNLHRGVYTSLRLLDRRDENLSNELVESARRVHFNLLEEARIDMPRTHQRPALDPRRQQLLDPLSSNRSVRFSRDENGRAEHVARCGDRSSSRDLERAHAAMSPAYQSEQLSRKRIREEETWDRERLVRHRMLSGIVSPPLLLPTHLPPSVRLKANVQKEDRTGSQNETRYWQTGEEDHEGGQVIPPSPLSAHKVQPHGIESKKQFLDKEPNVKVVGTRKEATQREAFSDPRHQSRSAGPSCLEFWTNSRSQRVSSRPPKARDDEVSAGVLMKPLNRSKEKSLSNRDLLPSPRRRNERPFGRLERVGAIFESTCNLASGLSDNRSKEANRKSEDYTTPLVSILMGRRHEGPRHKRQHQVQGQDVLRRDSRSVNSRNVSRVGGAELDSFLSDGLSKETSRRTDNGTTRKTLNTAKDSQPVREMTISVQKYGQRIVKVEEYKPRDNQYRVTGQSVEDSRLVQRGGGLRGFLDNSFTVSAGIDWSGVMKRKEYGGRTAAAAQEKLIRSKSFNAHQQHLEKPIAQERLPTYTQLAKKDLIGPIEKEPQRCKSIFTRLTGLRPNTTPTSPRIPAEIQKKDSSLLPDHDEPSLALSRRNSSTVLGQIVARNDLHENTLKFQGFSVSAGLSMGAGFPGEFNSGMMNPNRNGLFAEQGPSKKLDPCERSARGSPNVQTLVQTWDVSPHEESVSTPQLESVHRCKITFSPLELGPEGIQKDLRLEGCSEPLRSPQVEFASPAWEPGGSPRPLSSETGAAEAYDESPVNKSKLLPKLIATGHHKKDQILKESVFNVDKDVRRSSALPEESVVLVENANLEQCEKTSSISTEVLVGCRPETQNGKGYGFGNTSSSSDRERSSTQSNLGDKRNINISRPSEAILKVREFVSIESTPTSLSSPGAETPHASWDAIEFKQPRSSSILKIPSGSPTFLCGSLTVASKLHADGEADSGASIEPMVSSALSMPKEVRLFGANLNAPVGEQGELTQKYSETTEAHVVDSFTLAPDNGQDSVSVEKIWDSTAVDQGSKKDVCLSVLHAGGKQLLQLSTIVKPEQTVWICHNGSKGPKSIDQDESLVQAQPEESLWMPREQHVPPSPLQRATPAASLQGRLLSSTYVAGAHTWHRGTSFSAIPINNPTVFRAKCVGDRVVQSAGGSRSAQSTAYVRKGNSLVRAPGTTYIQSANDIKAIAAISGQRKPLARKLPMIKTVSCRSRFIANSISSTPYFPASKKYVAPLIKSDGGFVPSVLPGNYQKIPSSSIEVGLSQSSLSVTLRTLPQDFVKDLHPQLDSSTLLAAHQEERNGEKACSTLPLLHVSDDNLGETGVCRSAKDTTSSSHNIHVTSVQGIQGGRVPEKSGIANTLYVRRKANQLVVAPTQHTTDVLSVDPARRQPTKGRFMLDHYFKRKTNQLVRNICAKGNSAESGTQDLIGSGLSSSLPGEERGSTLVSKKIRRFRALRQKKGSPGRSSWVWTLSGAVIGHGSNLCPENHRTGPLLFPWKRQNSLRTPVRSPKFRPFPEGKKGSLLFLMSKRLRKVRPVQPVYTRSANGFSLHRSGVLSLGGGNLKWTKSLEKRAKQASEEVTKAVAEAERIRREKKEAIVEAVTKAKDQRRAARKAALGEGEQIVWVGLVRYKMDAASKTLRRVPDTQGETGDTDRIVPTGWAKNSRLLTPRRSIIGGTVYLRVGNGNQLIRDPKAASRALASEKVRWSLHNARSRGAKKQQYCQFFTKFGNCNKMSGKCPYIHDPEKVAVCTKFLKGNCTDVDCLLTHKVLPERMPDCSFFLEGLCTNENCPYRHVNVNPKASYCDGFLRGYCKDGDKCNKKHTYVCPMYGETGECPDQSTCKFHHPRKKNKTHGSVNHCKIGVKNKWRYFSTREPQAIRQKIDIMHNEASSMAVEDGNTLNEGLMEFISLSNIDCDEEQMFLSPSQPFPEPMVTREAGFAEEMEKWIKPAFLLQMTSSRAAACRKWA